MDTMIKQIGQGLKVFIGSYILIYCFPFPINYLPYAYEILIKHVNDAKLALNIWIGKQLFGMDELYHNAMNGSGDTTLDYIALVSYALLAVILTFTIFIFLKRSSYLSQFYPLMLIYARYFVGITLISYGIVKFLNGQFPGFNYFSLESTYGESSPMGLAWRFFGYSELYKGFMGVSEILAGGLLLFRRTAVLGSLISIAVCSNIFLVNMSFDVPVKLFSGHLLFFSILIVSPNLKPLVDFFLLKKEASIQPTQYRLDKKWKKLGYISFKIIFAGLVPLSLGIGHFNSQSYYNYLNEWEGLYEVNSFEIVGKPDLDESVFWEKIFIEGQTIMTQNKAKTKNFYSIDHIWNEGQIFFIENQNQEDPHQLTLKQQEDGQYHFDIQIGSNNYLVQAKRKIKNDYLLMNRGFRWVNETPFNR